MASVTISFTLDSDEHANLLRWLKSLPKRERSGVIREALLTHLGQGGSVSLNDVYQAVKELDRRLKNGAFVGNGETSRGEAPDEPPDVAANLDGLGL